MTDTTFWAAVAALGIVAMLLCISRFLRAPYGDDQFYDEWDDDEWGDDEDQP